MAGSRVPAWSTRPGGWPPGRRFEEALRSDPDVPFIFVSGALGEERAIDSLLRGATDYVLAHRPERLVPAVQRALGEAAVRLEHRRAEAALRESEARARLALAAGRMRTWEHEVATGVLRLARDCFDMIGVGQDVFGGTFEAFSRLVHREDRARFGASSPGSWQGRAPGRWSSAYAVPTAAPCGSICRCGPCATRTSRSGSWAWPPT